MNIKELEIGKQQNIRLLVRKIERATAKNTSIYQKLNVRDSDGNEAIILNWGEPINVNTPSVINANIETQEYRENASYRLINCLIDTDSSIEDFLPKAEIDVKKSLKEVVSIYKGMRESLRIIVGAVLNDNIHDFKTLPLSQSRSFARQSGVLEATLKLCRMVSGISKEIGIDNDLALAGAMLYYIGCVNTIDQSFNYTADDTLIGLGISSYTKLITTVNKLQSTDEEKAKNINMEEVKMLGHILLSRSKGLQTSIPEALTLRHLDQIVTETEIMGKCIDDMSPGSITYLNGSKVFKKSS